MLIISLGIALHDALAHYIPAHVSIRLKWPNDILIDGKKCAGMLHAIELRQDWWSSVRSQCESTY